MGAVGFGVHAGDEFIAPQDGEDEVAVFAFGGGDVALNDVIEVEEPAQAVALDDEVVERGEDADVVVFRLLVQCEGFGQGVAGDFGEFFHAQFDDFAGFEQLAQGGFYFAGAFGVL